MNPFVLAEATHDFIKSRKWDVAVLPFGATEPHNFHMPYGTDTFQLDTIGRSVCKHAFEKGANVLLLPTIPYGVNTNLLKVPGAVTMSVTPTTLLKILADLVDSLERQGVKKLMLLNGHGGNELKPLARELFHTHDMFICICDWFRVGSDVNRMIFAEPGDHADEIETSLGMAFFPDLLDLSKAGSGAVRPTRFEAIEKKWVSISRPWQLLTQDTGVGNPKAASADKGRRLVEILTERIGQFLYELATTPMDESFPFK
jgi:creatinine amidohydrolase